jgi:hypothetical protein
MLSQILFHLVSRLIFSRWARDYEEHHGSCEDAYAARFGPLRLEVNCCFALDHRDAAISVAAPTFWGRLRASYMVCLGEEQIRQPGFSLWLPKPLSAQKPKPGNDYFPL